MIWSWTLPFHVLALTYHVLSKVKENAAPAPGMRRKSNEGHRKLGLDDQLLLFFMRFRRRVPFEGLGIQFGISTATAHKYYHEVLDVFHEKLVRLLLHPLDAATCNSFMEEEFKEKLPGAKFIVDLTSFKMKSKENASLARILYSAYHHQSEAAAVFGKTPPLATSYPLSSSILKRPLQWLRQMDCSCIGQNFLGGSHQRS